MHVYSSHPAGFSNPYPAMADDAAAHDADDGSVESNETAATVDERDLLSDDESGGGAGDDDTPSEDEADEPDGSGGGGPAFRVREVECGESILVIMDISLPPVGRPGGKARLGSFLFLRQCEELLYGSTAGSYTGALHAAVKVNVFEKDYPYHDAPYRHIDATNTRGQSMGLESSLRVMEKSTALEVMEADEWAALMDVYTTMRRRDDPLCGAAKRFTILPTSLGASLALARRHRDMLVALGKKPPRKWEAEVRRRTTTTMPSASAHTMHAHQLSGTNTPVCSVSDLHSRDFHHRNSAPS